MPSLTHYKLNGDASDASGNGYHGTPTDVTYPAGKIAQAGSFNGSTSKIVLPNETSSDLGGASGATVSAWVKRGAIGGTQVLLGLFISGGLNKLFIAFNSSNKLYAGGRSTYPENLQYVVAVNAYTDTTGWHHVVATVDLATNAILIYLDGVLQETSGTPSFAQTTFSAAVGSVGVVGAGSGGGSYPIDGLLDDVRLYDEVLPAWKIEAIYNNGNGTEAKVFGPYRREESQTTCTGAAVGQEYCTGAAIGQDYHSGTDAGQA